MKTLVTASLLLLLAAAPAALAQRKGAEQLLSFTSRPDRVQTSAPVEKMSCPTQLQSEVRRAGGRGAHQRVIVRRVHDCPTCETKIVSVGAGKQAAQEVRHSCATAAACCKGKS